MFIVVAASLHRRQVKHALHGVVWQGNSGSAGLVPLRIRPVYWRRSRLRCRPQPSRWDACARAAGASAASAHAAAPPRSVMKSYASIDRIAFDARQPNLDRKDTNWRGRQVVSELFTTPTWSESGQGQSLPSHDGLKSCDVRCWSDSCQKIAGSRMQRSVFQQNSLVIRSSRPHRRTPAIRGTRFMEYSVGNH
jgi:hypothetical protein